MILLKMVFHCFCSSCFFFFLREIFGIVSFSVMFMMNSCKRFSYNVFSFFNLGAMALQMECLLVTL